MSASTSSFPRFSELPPELRVQIWNTILKTPRKIKLTRSIDDSSKLPIKSIPPPIIKGYSAGQSLGKSQAFIVKDYEASQLLAPSKLFRVDDQGSPALLYVNVESQVEAQRFYTDSFPGELQSAWDHTVGGYVQYEAGPSIPVSYIYTTFVVRHAINDLAHPVSQKIRHLECPSIAIHQDFWLEERRFMKEMPALETLHVTFDADRFGESFDQALEWWWDWMTNTEDWEHRPQITVTEQNTSKELRKIEAGPKNPSRLTG